jgi:sphingolipid 4-desaturase/C4-monooxygenase
MGKGGDATLKGTVTSPSDDDSTTLIKTTTIVDTTITKHENDFYWSTNDEPHATRRKLILKKYPEIQSLYGHCTMLKYKILVCVIVQLSIAYYYRNQFQYFTTKTTTPPTSNTPTSTSSSTSTSIASWVMFWVIAYVIGGTCNHMCMMGLHELSHNLGFKRMKYNLYYAIFVCNVPITVPSAVSFKRYHMDHHKYQGVDTIDVDIPTITEGHIFTTTLRKLFFVLFQIGFYAIRPSFVNPKAPSMMEIINILYILSTNIMIAYFWGVSSLFYLFISTWLGTGLHPCAGHFIAEHYVFPTDDDSVPETYSYYGIVNYFTFNVGYHNEHHDFPFIPGSRLPKLNEIAGPEFYNHLPHHTSYMKVLYDYITVPSVTAFSRVKRMNTIYDPDGVPSDLDVKFISKSSNSTTKPIKVE